MIYSPPFETPAVPGVYMAISSELFEQGLNVPHRGVLLGQHGPGAEVAPLTPTQIRSPLEADKAWGPGSMLAEMCRVFLDNSDTELWAVAVPEAPGATAAESSLDFGGVAEASGTLTVRLAGRTLRVGIAKGTDPAAAAAALHARLADEPRLAVTHDTEAAQVRLTCKWRGATGNELHAEVLEAPEGLTITGGVFEGGATDPEVDLALSTLGGMHVHTLGTAYADLVNLAHCDSFFERRFGPKDQRDGLVFAVSRGSYAELLTLASELNSKFIVLGGPGRTASPSWIIAAATASADADITRRQPNEGRKGRVLRGVLPPAIADRFDHDQRHTLLRSGISTYGVTASGHLALERLVTSRTLNDDGFPDAAYSDIVTMRVLAAMRYDLRRRGSKWSDWLVATDESMARQPKVMTPKRFSSLALTPAYMAWKKASWVQDVATFKSLLKVVVSEAADGFFVFIPATIVRPLRVVAGEIAFK